jgi:hypothetical protein
LKKLSAILLLALLLFNFAGYKVWFYFLQVKADQQLETSLDNNDYNEADLVTIKVPLSLPYQTNWSDFERYDGEISVDGKIYKYVKRMVYNDELILLCLPNENKMRLQNAKDEFFKYANDLMQSDSSKKSNNNTCIYKNVLSEYYKQTQEEFCYFNPQKRNNYFVQNNLSIIFFPHTSPDHPPESA